MSQNIIKEEFKKHPTLMSLMIKWHQESPIELLKLYHLKALYKENIHEIKQFRMSLKQFQSFEELYSSLNTINAKSKRVFNHPFFYLKESMFKEFLDKNGIDFFIADNGNIVATITTVEESQFISPETWCISNRKDMFQQYIKGSGKVFITFDKKQKSIIGTSISDSVISFNHHNKEAETPKNVMHLIKPMIYKNYLRNLIKIPLISGIMLSIFIFLLFSDVFIGEHQLTLNYQCFLTFIISTLGIIVGFSFLTTPPNASSKSKENFVFAGFIFTIVVMGASIASYIDIKKDGLISELETISNNPEVIISYQNWHLEKNVYYKEFPSFLQYNGNRINCTDSPDKNQKKLNGVTENRNFCYLTI